MPPLPSIPPREVIRALEKVGFKQLRQRGSHVVMYKEGFPGQPVVALHNKDVKKGTLRSIIRQAGLTVEEFVEKL